MSKKWGKTRSKILRATDAAPEFFRCSAEPIEFDLQADAQGAKKIKKFSLTAYTGAAMRPSGWYQAAPLVVDIQGMAIPRQNIPADYEHGDLVGHTTRIDTSAQRIKMDGVLSAYSESEQTPSAIAAREITRLAGAEFPWQASMEFSISKPEFVEAGEKINVNGKAFQGPLYVARTSVLRRISIVANGADGDTSTSIAASLPGVSTMFETWLKANGFDPATTSADQRKFLQAAFDAEQKAKTQPQNVPPPAVVPPVITPVVDPVETFRAGMAVEVQRVADITSICLIAGNPNVEIEEAGVKRKVNLQAHAIAQKWDVDKTRNRAELEQLRATYVKPQGAPYIVGAGGSALPQEQVMQAREAALCIQAGLTEKEIAKHFAATVIDASTSKHFRQQRVSSLMHDTIRAAGLHAAPGSITDDTIRVFLKAEQTLKASGFTTLGLSNTLSNLANKAMLAAYQRQNVLWPLFTATRSHGDFKVHTRLRLDPTGAFKLVGATGELKHVGLSDAAYTNQLGTYGAIITFNRQMMINDDLGAFVQVPMFLGSMSNLRIEEAFFVLLLSNPSTFFGSGNKNLVSGSGGAMTAANGLAAITAAEQKFTDQIDSNAKPILTPPDRMLLGSSNYIPARNIYEGRVKITGANQTEVANNEHAGKYQPHRSPYVSNTAIKDQDGSAITGQSSTAWWLFADPNVRAAVGIAFLNGIQVPTIESEDTEFETLGMQWRAYLDFGLGMEDVTAAVQINGA